MKFTFNQSNHKLMVDDINSDDWEDERFPNREHECMNVELGEFVYLIEENTLYITPNRNNFYDIFNIVFNKNRDIIEENPNGRNINVSLDRTDFTNIKNLVIKDYNQFSKDYPNLSVELLYTYITGIETFYEAHWNSDSWQKNDYDTELEWDITKTKYSDRVVESFNLLNTIKELKIE